MIVDQTVTIPADSQMTGIPGHIQEVGTVGNLGQNGFHFYDDLEIENDSAFTGGTSPQLYPYVQQSDIDNAANGLISANQPDAQRVLQTQAHANERFVGTPQCTPNTPNANHQAGDHATTVTVSVNFTCTGEVYDYNGALSLARQLLRKQAANNPGSACALTGQIIVSLQSASFNGQTVTLLVAAKGIWVYQISAAQRQAWANLVVGQSPQAAQTRLVRQQSVARVTIRLTGVNAQVLPTDAQKIIVVVQTVPGF
jgi:VCBS repeat-containing protein